jgi:UrcA family protein
VRARLHAAAALLLAVVVVAAPEAGAHRASLTYSDLEISDDRRQARYEIRIAAGDLFEALALDRDREATDQEIL